MLDNPRYLLVSGARVNTFLPLLLDVWREACRYIRIDQSVARVGPVLAQRLPVALILVRRLEPVGGNCDTVAGTLIPPGGQGLPSQSRSHCDPAVMARLRTWCGTAVVLRAQAGELRGQLPGLLPEGLMGDVLAGGLASGGSPLGALILVAAQHLGFDEQHRLMAQALLEPMAVALANDARVRELERLREAAEADRASLLSRLGRQDIADTVVGAESGLREVMERVGLVARTEAPVLVLGETGTGKEVVARAVHAGSKRAGGPFLRVNCGAIAADLIDSELFGHERGSFTGAVATRKGWFERADGGTLFLDEVGELTPAAQVRLLRVVQDGTFERVGGRASIHVDVRLVAATNRDLRAMVEAGTFRQDLWYRIAVFPIVLPPLRERPQDIAALAYHFARRAAARLGLTPQHLDAEDQARLCAYPWPGNVRELASVMERAAILGEGRSLAVGAALGVTAPRLPAVPGDALVAVPPTPFATLDGAMVRHIELALVRSGGRIEGPWGAARLLGINPHTLRARMRRLGVDWAQFRGAV